MVRIQVQPGWLGTAAAGHTTLGDAFSGVSAGVANTGGAAAASAGDAALGHGIGAASERMGAGVQSLMGEMHGLAAALDAAAQAYAATDESAMPEAR